MRSLLSGVLALVLMGGAAPAAHAAKITAEDAASANGKDDGGQEDTSDVAQVGAWSIAIDQTLDNNCFAYAVFNSAIALRIGFDAGTEASGYIWILGRQWASIRTGGDYKIELTFGAETPWEAVATGMQVGELGGLRIDFTGDDILKEFAAAQNLAIHYKGEQVAAVNFDNGAEVYRELLRCQRTRPAPSRDPFAR